MTSILFFDPEYAADLSAKVLKNPATLPEDKKFARKVSATASQGMLNDLNAGGWSVIIATLPTRGKAEAAAADLRAKYPDLFASNFVLSSDWGPNIYEDKNGAWGVFSGGFYSQSSASVLRDRVVQLDGIQKDAFIWHLNHQVVDQVAADPRTRGVSPSAASSGNN